MSFPPNNDDRQFLELLRKWLRGDFTRADERALQALTEADAFRREAWEGLEGLPEVDHEQRLAALGERLRARSGGELRVGAVNRQRVLLAAAAVFLVLIAGIVFLRPADDPADMASTAAQPDSMPAWEAPVATTPQANTPMADSVFSSSDYAVAPEAQRAVGPPGRGVVPSPAMPQSNQAADAVLSPSPAATGATSTTSAPPPAAESDVAFAEEKEAAKVEQRPAAQQPKRQAEAEWDRFGKKRAAAPARQSPPATADTSYSGQRAPASPVEGWDAFRRYLQTARLNDAARNNNVSGYVRLRFAVDDQGRPTDIAVLHSLGFGLDEEAIRLVRAKAWRPGGPVTVDVPFVR
jgi:TonB family protein